MSTWTAQHELSKPLRYPSYFNVRWVEFVFNFFNAILRNWRVSIMYFQSEKLQSRLHFWTQYDTLHSLTFLTDVLFLLKRFQKSYQSDTITLIELSRLSDRLFEKLEHCKMHLLKKAGKNYFFKNWLPMATISLSVVLHWTTQQHEQDVLETLSHPKKETYCWFTRSAFKNETCLRRVIIESFRTICQN